MIEHPLLFFLACIIITAYLIKGAEDMSSPTNCKTEQERWAWEEGERDAVIQECSTCGEMFNTEELDGDCPYCKEAEDD